MRFCFSNFSLFRKTTETRTPHFLFHPLFFFFASQLFQSLYRIEPNRHLQILSTQI